MEVTRKTLGRAQTGSMSRRCYTGIVWSMVCGVFSGGSVLCRTARMHGACLEDEVQTCTRGESF